MLVLTSLMSITGIVSSSYSDSSSELDSSSDELDSVGVEGVLFGDLKSPSSRRLLNLLADLGPWLVPFHLLTTLGSLGAFSFLMETRAGVKDSECVTKSEPFSNAWDAKLTRYVETWNKFPTTP